MRSLNFDGFMTLKYIFPMLFCYAANVCGQTKDSATKVVSLQGVTVNGNTTGNKVLNQPVKATVLGVHAVQEQPATITELLNRTPGIRVRQSGGTGSTTDISINGFSGKAIRYFKDDIPTDYLGTAFNFSALSLNMLERVEVYKGVVPVSLGGDALGGAVNMVSRQQTKSSLDASYQFGSFNTHLAAVNGVWVAKSNKVFAGVSAFYNHSDNNYKVEVPVIDANTAVAHTEKLPLFHNQFTQAYAEVYGGVKNLRWADELRLGITWFDINRNYNFGATMDKSLGGVTGSSHTLLPTLRYRKSLLNERLTIDQFLVVGTLHTAFTDTAKGYYDWYGTFYPLSSRVGELYSNGSYTRLEYENITSRTNIKFQLNAANVLIFNAVYNKGKRIGTNPNGDVFYESKRDILSVPAYYEKFVAALGLDSKIWKDKLTNSLIVKYFQVKASGNTGSFGSTEEDYSHSNSSRGGVAEAIRFRFAERNYLNLSGELATRLPEQAEFFGDGNFLLANFSLKPERSLNFNFGVHLEKAQKASIELNTFYRRTHDLILAISSGMFSQNLNVQNVKGLGTEIDASVHLRPWLMLNGNVTYQDMRLFGLEDPTYENARLRNTPYFFSNLGAQANFKRLFRRSDPFKVYWFYSFVREYYLNYIPKSSEASGFLGLWGKPTVNASSVLIPDQNLHTVGCTWWPDANRRYAAGVEVKNVFNTPVFDNFRIQNAGRSINLKLSYQFH